MSNDLQVLYKMRDIFKREQYTKSYNAKVNDELRQATNARVAKEITAKNTAYNNWNKAFADKTSALNLRSIIIGVFLGVVGLLLFPLITNWLTKSNDWAQLYYYASALWISVICIFSFLFTAKSEHEFRFNNVKINEPSNTKHYNALSALVFIALVVFYFSMAVYFASLTGACHNFGTWLLGVIVMVFWPVANFFFISRASWIVLLVVVLFALWMLFLVAAYVCPESNFTKAFNDSNVKNLYNTYNNSVAIYNQAYNAEYANIKGQYTHLLKPDTSAQEKRALESVIPKQFQDIDTINKWIWCIEQRYANTIVEARNWYLQQAQNAAMQQKLASVAEEMRRSNEIAAQAATDARKAHEESMRAAAKTQKSLDKLNATARENAATNKDIANSVDKIYREIKY